MTNLIHHFYGIYGQIYDWNGIYDLNNIQLRQRLYKVSMTNLIQHFMVSMTKFMTGMVSMTLIIIQLRLAGGSGVRLYDGPDLKLFILVGWGRSFLSVAWPTGVQLVFFFCSGVSRLFGAQGSPSSGSLLNL